MYSILMLLILAALAGALSVLAVPEAGVLAVVVTPLLICIVLGLAVTVQNRGLDTSLSALIFPVKPFNKVRPSRTLLALSLSAAFAVGACVRLLLAVAYA
jgi:hypothetical protein